jgi:hypothetical protein
LAAAAAAAAAAASFSVAVSRMVMAMAMAMGTASLLVVASAEGCVALSLHLVSAPSLRNGLGMQPRALLALPARLHL